MTPEADRFAALAAELPSHGRWVRALARSLVLDEAAAEDLAQEVQLAALRRPGSIRGALAPWLARVTRNLARRAWLPGSANSHRTSCLHASSPSTHA